MNKRRPTKPRLIHPPEIGPRKTAQEFADALARANSDPAALAIVQDETKKATRKREYIKLRPGVLYDEQARDLSAGATEAAGMASWRAASEYQGDRGTQSRRAAAGA